MGGRVITFPFIKAHGTGFHLAIVLTVGKLLRHEHVGREIRVGKYYIDFGNDICRGIEIDGKDFHMDIVKETERDTYCKRYGWRLLHIQAIDIYQKPDVIYRRVQKFLIT